MSTILVGGDPLGKESPSVKWYQSFHMHNGTLVCNKLKRRTLWWGAEPKRIRASRTCLSFHLQIPKIPSPHTSQQANKLTGKQTAHAQTSCAYRGPDMTEWVCRGCNPAVLTPGKWSQDKLDSGLWKPGTKGATVTRRPHTARVSKDQNVACTEQMSHQAVVKMSCLVEI